MLPVTAGKIPSLGAVRRGALPPMLRRRHVWELIGSLVLGDGRLEPGGHSLASDERQHDFGRVVRQRPAVAHSEAECRGRPHYEGQDIGEELAGNGLPVALWVTRGSVGRDDGRDMLGDVLALRVKVSRRVPGVGGIGELYVVWPEDRPHHGITAAIDLSPAARVRGQFWWRTRRQCGRRA